MRRRTQSSLGVQDGSGFNQLTNLALQLMANKQAEKMYQQERADKLAATDEENFMRQIWANEALEKQKKLQEIKHENDLELQREKNLSDIFRADEDWMRKGSDEIEVQKRKDAEQALKDFGTSFAIRNAGVNIPGSGVLDNAHMAAVARATYGKLFDEYGTSATGMADTIRAEQALKRAIAQGQLDSDSVMNALVSEPLTKQASSQATTRKTLADATGAEQVNKTGYQSVAGTLIPIPGLQQAPIISETPGLAPDWKTVTDKEGNETLQFFPGVGRSFSVQRPVGTVNAVDFMSPEDRQLLEQNAAAKRIVQPTFAGVPSDASIVAQLASTAARRPVAQSATQPRPVAPSIPLGGGRGLAGVINAGLTGEYEQTGSGLPSAQATYPRLGKFLYDMSTIPAQVGADVSGQYPRMLPSTANLQDYVYTPQGFVPVNKRRSPFSMLQP